MLVEVKIISCFFIGIIGLILGSFFNVCILRIPKGESIVYPPSHCSCGHILKWYELIPVLSWIGLKGRCRKCKEKISFQYPLIEILTAVIFVIIFLFFGFSINTIKFLVLFSILLIDSIIDIKTQEVYFSISIVAFIFGIIFNIVGILQGGSLEQSIISVIIAIVLMGIIYLGSKKFEGFGLGDVEIIVFISLYVAPSNLVVVIFLAIILGGIYSIGLLLKGERGRRIAFVPFIAVGALIGVTFGTQLLDMYIKLL
ncbi:MAG: prepilin peptidase [Clostridium sp.]